MLIRFLATTIYLKDTMYLEINKYHLFTFRIHTTILSKGGKVMNELVNFNSELFEHASIPPIFYID